MTRSRDIADQQKNLGGAVPGFAAGKNKIINGDFSIWQRGTSITLPNATATYTSDRYVCNSQFSAGSSTFTQQTFTPGSAPVAGYEGTYFGRLTAGSTASYFDIFQRIEDVRTFAGQTVTFSFWAKASVSTAMTILVRQYINSTGPVISDATSNITVGTSWTRYTFTTTLGSLSGKTIGAINYLTAGFYTTSSVTGSMTFDTWGWQLEAGSVATPFATATGNPASELAACQRYYFRSLCGGAGQGYSRIGTGAFASATTAYVPIQHPVPMRVAPTAVEYSNVGLYDYGADRAATAVSIQGDCNSQFMTLLNISVASGGTQYRPVQLENNGSASGYIGLTAEL